MKIKIISLSLIIAVIALAYLVAPELIGRPPEKVFIPEHQKVVSELFPELNPMREEVEQATPDQKLTKLVKFAEIIKAKIQATRNKELTFELISILNEITELDPKNSFALIELANLSFESKVFTKAAQYYQSYLVDNPEDYFNRGRYASSLIFLNQVDLALIELDNILLAKPDDFAALAYKAIALGQVGRVDEARVVGELALKHAPDETGSDRLLRFLASLDSAKGYAFEKYLKTNQITSSKYQSYEIDGKTLKLYFNSFPMDQMPEIAKQKFFTKIKLAIEEEVESLPSLSFVSFFDLKSGKELESLRLQ